MHLEYLRLSTYGVWDVDEEGFRLEISPSTNADGKPVWYLSSYDSEAAISESFEFKRTEDLLEYLMPVVAEQIAYREHEAAKRETDTD